MVVAGKSTYASTNADGTRSTTNTDADGCTNCNADACACAYGLLWATTNAWPNFHEIAGLNIANRDAHSITEKSGLEVSRLEGIKCFSNNLSKKKLDELPNS